MTSGYPVFAVLILTCLAVASPVARAEKVGWHPSAVLQLGRGVELRNPDKIRPVVAVLSDEIASGPSTGEAQIRAKYVQHAYEIAESFSINASLSARNITYEGKIGLKFADAFKESRNAISFVFECNRDFGDRIHQAVSMSRNFVSEVEAMKETVSDAALHRAVIDRFGTHFVSGRQRAAKVVLLYNLTYQSQYAKRAAGLDFSARYSAGLSGGEFESAIRSEMSRTDTKVNLDYQFYSTDPINLPGFPLTQRISNFDEFIAHVQNVEEYCKTLEPDRAKDIAYILEPIQNLPGYTELIGGFRPENQFESGYERFMRIYSEFKNWENTLREWTGDVLRMSWLNSEGQRLVLGMRADVSRHLVDLEETARRHFEQGTPLEVSEEIVNFRANLTRIPIPRIVILQKRYLAPGPNKMVCLGYVNAGPRELVSPQPFRVLIAVDNSGKVPSAGINLLYVKEDVEGFEKGLTGSIYAGWRDFANFVVSTPGYQSARAHASSNVLGFFAWENINDGDRGGEVPRSAYTFQLRDAADELIDEVSVLAERNDVFDAPVE